MTAGATTTGLGSTHNMKTTMTESVRKQLMEHTYTLPGGMAINPLAVTDVRYGDDEKEIVVTTEDDSEYTFVIVEVEGEDGSSFFPVEKRHFLAFAIRQWNARMLAATNPEEKAEAQSMVHQLEVKLLGKAQAR